MFDKQSSSSDKSSFSNSSAVRFSDDAGIQPGETIGNNGSDSKSTSSSHDFDFLGTPYVAQKADSYTRNAGTFKSANNSETHDLFENNTSYSIASSADDSDSTSDSHRFIYISQKPSDTSSFTGSSNTSGTSEELGSSAVNDAYQVDDSSDGFNISGIQYLPQFPIFAIGSSEGDDTQTIDNFSNGDMMNTNNSYGLIHISPITIIQFNSTNDDNFVDTIGPPGAGSNTNTQGENSSSEGKYQAFVSFGIYKNSFFFT